MLNLLYALHLGIPSGDVEGDVEARWRTFLKQWCAGRMADRYPPAMWPSVAERLDYELNMIVKSDLLELFLVLREVIVGYAGGRGIPVRLTASPFSGSVAAYLAGLIEADPIAHELVFELYMLPRRVPDVVVYIDVPQGRGQEFLGCVQLYCEAADILFANCEDVGFQSHPGKWYIGFRESRTLRLITDTLSRVRRRTGKAPELPADPVRDPATRRLLADDAALAPLEVEGLPAGLLGKAHVQSLDDLAFVVAHGYSDCKCLDGWLSGVRNESFPAALFERFTALTRGQMVYEDQALLALVNVYGLGWVEAMTVMQGLESIWSSPNKRFMEGYADFGANLGIGPEQTQCMNQALCDMLANPYSKGAVLAKALTAARGAFLKARYPDEFGSLDWSLYERRTGRSLTL